MPVDELDLKTLSLAILQIAEEKGIPEEKVFEILEMALAAAYKKEYGRKPQKVRAKFDKEKNRVHFFLVKRVVSEDMILKEGEKPPPRKEGEEGPRKIRFNPERHILLEEAKKIKPDAKPGDEIEFPLPRPERFGRIAAQTAKQVLLQRLKEAEREAIYEEFIKKEGEIISGTIQRREGKTVFVDIGKTVGILLKEDQIPGEFYKVGSRMRFYCLKVKPTTKGPEIYLSRTHPKFLSKLFELEVPEIASGTVVIKSVAREAGSRSKVAVASTEEGVDPVGSCVGPKGTRVNAVMQELGKEKIDIIPYSDKPEEFIENALAPAKVIKVHLKKTKAIAEVPKDQLSLAIGKEGQNVRLASQLTGWKIDVVPAQEEVKKEESTPSETEKETPEEKKEDKEEKKSQ